MSTQTNNNNIYQEVFESNFWHTDTVNQLSENSAEHLVVCDSTPRIFLGNSTGEIMPILRPVLTAEWLSSTILLITAVIVILWFLMPNRKALIHDWRHPFERPGDGSTRKPGFVFSFLFFLNYLFVIAVFVVLNLQHFGFRGDMASSTIELFFFTSVVVVIYSLSKLAVISLTGFIFETRSAAELQIRLYMSQNSLTGFLLLGILVLIFFTDGVLFFYLGLFILLSSNLIKWVQTIAIGNITTQFKLYHLIIYLCTLELIPLLLLIKLINF